MSQQETLFALARPVVEKEGLELVDLEYKKEGKRWMLRVFIDGPEGISHDECVRVTRALEPVLEEEDPIPHGFVLEVSSPGLDRPLKRDRDFERARGKKVEIKTFGPLVNKQKTLRGTLLGLADKDLRLELEDGSKITIPRDQVAKARLHFEF